MTASINLVAEGEVMIGFVLISVKEIKMSQLMDMCLIIESSITVCPREVF